MVQWKYSLSPPQPSVLNGVMYTLSLCYFTATINAHNPTIKNILAELIRSSIRHQYTSTSNTEMFRASCRGSKCLHHYVHAQYIFKSKGISTKRVLGLYGHRMSVALHQSRLGVASPVSWLESRESNLGPGIGYAESSRVSWIPRENSRFLHIGAVIPQTL
jgi:hypothetical protein